MDENTHPGITEWTNPNGIHIFRLHYSADAEKGDGEKVFVGDEKLWLSPWAKAQYDGMTSKASYRQEFEIDFAAKSGALLYPFTDEATLEPLSALPAEGTNYYFLDPHPRTPHAHLWIRVDRWGDAWAYRELWPSKIYGQQGKVPEDDNRFRIRDYVETVKYLEEGETIFRRIIDYAARAFTGMGETEDKTIQQRYEEESDKVDYPMRFEDAIKDNEAGIDAVLDWLKPRDVEMPDGAFKPKSKLHIIKERCPELIWELHNNRFEQLTPVMAERRDPSARPQPKRNHLTDLLKYACLCGLRHVSPMRKSVSTWKPLHPGVAY